MARSFDVSVILKLIDQFTGPSRQAARAMTQLQRNMQNAMRAVNAFSRMRASANPFIAVMGRMGRAVTEFQVRTRKALADVHRDFAKLGVMGDRLREARWSLITTGFFMSPLAFPFIKSANMEESLTRLGQVGEFGVKDGTFGMAAFVDELKAMNEEVRRLSRATYTDVKELTDGLAFLVQTGLPLGDARRGIETIGIVSTATGSAIEDLSKSAYAFRQNLKIVPEGWRDAFNILHQAGKMGGFELKDAAKWLPELSTNMSFFGMEGLEAVKHLGAMLQIVRRGAADADQAANNLANIFQKFFIKETATNFKKYAGIDFAEEMTRAIKAGVNPILHLLDLIDQFAGANPFAVGKFFGDRQALDALKPLLRDARDLAPMMREIDKAVTVDVIGRDFLTSIRMMKENVEQLTTAIGNLNDVMMRSIFGDAKGVTQTIAGWVDGIKTFAEQNEGLVRNLLIGFAGLAGGALIFRTIAVLVNSFIYGFEAFRKTVKAVFAVLGAFKAFRLSGLFAGVAKGAWALSTALTAGIAAAVTAAAPVLGEVMGALARLALGPVGLGIAAAWIGWQLLPEEWKQRQLEAIPSFLEEVKSTFDSYAASIGQALGGLFGVPTPGYATPGQVPLLPQGGFGTDIRSLFERLSTPGQTIPSIGNTETGQTEINTDNRQTTINVSNNVSISMTGTQATPGAVAGAVTGAGQSVASEIKRALGDGGQ